MASLALDRTAWDLVLDVKGDIAVATGPYACAQDVATAIRLQLGELWYDTTKGIPYYSQILGHFPTLQLLKAQFVRAALTVPEVASAVVFLYRVGREIRGQVRVILKTSVVLLVNVGNLDSGGFVLGYSILGGNDLLGGGAASSGLDLYHPFILNRSTLGGNDLA